MKKKEIIDICNSIGISPNKRFGQSFICNGEIIDRIIDVSNINEYDKVLEIGPGLGILTERLVQEAGSVMAVEIDSGLVRYLEDKFFGIDKLKIVHADFLKFEHIEGFTKSISNLPYYCSSEILFRIATEYYIQDVFIMLQKEMAERIISRPGSRAYGALTVALSLYYKAGFLFNIDRSSFYPRPDIASSFIRLTRKDDGSLTKKEIKLFHNIVRSAFWGRRKKLLNALANSPHLRISRDIIAGVLLELNIDEKIRGEKLDLEQFKELTRMLSSRRG